MQCNLIRQSFYRSLWSYTYTNARWEFVEIRTSDFREKYCEALRLFWNDYTEDEVWNEKKKHYFSLSRNLSCRTSTHAKTLFGVDHFFFNTKNVMLRGPTYFYSWHLSSLNYSPSFATVDWLRCRYYTMCSRHSLDLTESE